MKTKKNRDDFFQQINPLLANLSNYARAICRNEENAKDLVQDTIINAYDNFMKLKNKKAFLSYLFTIASRLHKLNNKRNNFTRNNQAEVLKYLETKDYNAEKYDVEVLYNILNELNEKQRETIILFEISGLSIEEIRKIQGGTISGVKSRLKRGRARLKELLKKDILQMKDKIFY